MKAVWEGWIKASIPTNEIFYWNVWKGWINKPNLQFEWAIFKDQLVDDFKKVRVTVEEVE